MRTYASVEFDCGICSQRLELQIPVDVYLRTDDDGDPVVAAQVPQSEDYTEPLWRHAFDCHTVAGS